MAAYIKIHDFVEQALKGVHDLSTHSLKIALSNSPVFGAVLHDIAQIADEGGYTAGGYEVTGEVLSETSGVVKLVIDDLTITATGSAMRPFRYLIVYNDTPTSPADPLIAYYDYGSSLTLEEGESLTLDFDGTNGILSLS